MNNPEINIAALTSPDLSTERFDINQDSKPEAGKALPEQQSESPKLRLSKILETPLTLDNISEYGGVVLNSLIEFTNEVTANYKSANPEETSLSSEAAENRAFDACGLKNLSDTLDRVQSKIEQIENIKAYISAQAEQTDEVITPSRGLPYPVGEQAEQPVQKQLFPRLIVLLYILESDFKIPKEDVRLVRGNMLDQMQRDEPYYRIEIPRLNRLVYICDERGNASYIFNQELLDEIGISIPLLDNAMKGDRDTLIKEFPGIGKRVVQRAHWRSRIEELLGADIPEPSERDENLLDSKQNLPRVSVMETDPWRGFWIDGNGEHWGPILKIAQNFGSNNTTIQKLIEESEFKTIAILDANNTVRVGYCLEDIQKLPAVQHKEGLPKGGLTGEWSGYFTDTESFHWSVPTQMENKTGLHHLMILKEIRKANLRNIEMVDKSNQICKAYCYEEVIKISKLKKLIESPKVEQAGEWNGFHIDSEENHWGSVLQISVKLGVGIGIIEKVLGDFSQLQKKEVIDRNGVLKNAYCIEVIKQLPELLAWQRLPQISFDKRNRTFHTDQNNVRWGTLPHLAEMFGVTDRVIAPFLTNSQTILAKGDRGPTVKLYSYDTLLQDAAFQEKLSLLRQ